MRWMLIVFLSLVAVIPTQAQWTTTSQRDRLTERDSKIVSVIAKAPDKGVTAKLSVYCIKFLDETVATLDLDTSASFTRGKMGLRFRLDNAEPEERFMPVSGNGRGMSSWVQPIDLFGKKRLRVELLPAKSSGLLFDFDITGAEQTIRSLGCKQYNLFQS